MSEVIDSSSVDLRLLYGVTLSGRVSTSSPEASRSATATLLSQLCLHLITTGSSLLLKSKERNEKTRLFDFYLCLPERSCSGLVVKRVVNGEELNSVAAGATVDDQGDVADAYSSFIEEGLGRWARKELNPYLLDEVGWADRRAEDDGLLGLIEDDDEMSDATKAYEEVKNCVINEDEEDSDAFETLLIAEGGDETGKTAMPADMRQEEMWI